MLSWGCPASQREASPRPGRQDQSPSFHHSGRGQVLAAREALRVGVWAVPKEDGECLRPSDGDPPEKDNTIQTEVT